MINSYIATLREKYSLFTISRKKIDLEIFFLLNTFQIAFQFIVCLFVCFQQLAITTSYNYISKGKSEKCVKYLCLLFHNVLLLLYKDKCLKLLMAAADLSFAPYCIEMPLVWHYTLRKLYLGLLEFLIDKFV